MELLHLVIITGISGSGKTVALRQLEDQGFVCIDNLPVRFLQDMVNSACAEHLPRVAISVDVRTAMDWDNLPDVIEQLRCQPVFLQVLFLDASDAILTRRYIESRRQHPLTNRLREKTGQFPSLQACIDAERTLTDPLRLQAHMLDTSGATPAQLRSWVREVVAHEDHHVLITFESFSYKLGTPQDADLVFDVRCLPNPHYVPQLRPLTGRDTPVADWLAAHKLVQEWIEDVQSLLHKWIPRYLGDTRSYLTIAIGCTGGQHRSQYVTEQLAAYFAREYEVLIRHRRDQ